MKVEWLHARATDHIKRASEARLSRKRVTVPSNMFRLQLLFNEDE
jgi:hypothetical protein